jgi:hypothetical protein
MFRGCDLNRAFSAQTFAAAIRAKADILRCRSIHDALALGNPAGNTHGLKNNRVFFTGVFFF